MKKNNFSFSSYLKSAPTDQEIQPIDGALHIPIEALENALDFFTWGTQNFEWERYIDEEGNPCIMASLELMLPMEDEAGHGVIRRFIGACNFQIASILPIPDFLATAKSLCIKNAAKDAGRRFGRGLNNEIIPKQVENLKVKNNVKLKMKPDATVMKEFMRAVADKDQQTIATLSSVYDIKTEQNEGR